MAKIPPVVDFSPMSIELNEDRVTEDVYEDLGEKLVEAFSTIGFVYLTDSGIDFKQIDEANRISGEFFSLAEDVKRKYSEHHVADNHGWVGHGEEWLNKERPPGIKESFDITPSVAKLWPDEEVPEFRPFTLKLRDTFDSLAKRILRAIAYGLGLEDKNFFVKRHQEPTRSSLRYLFYPPLPEDRPEGQIGCGEHTDYGSITLLIQDEVGGLQLLTRENKWVDATPMKGAVLVNIGDMMQRWTADRLVSTSHRVMKVKGGIRRSMVYFVHAQEDLLISCIDDSNKYEPIKARDYMYLRHNAAYGVNN